MVATDGRLFRLGIKLMQAVVPHAAETKFDCVRSSTSSAHLPDPDDYVTWPPRSIGAPRACART